MLTIYAVAVENFMYIEYHYGVHQAKTILLKTYWQTVSPRQASK